jgi:protein-S-isoprenylcysteine O-methyltransferase Ste14
MMRATEFEFRYRFWFIGLIFWAAFSCYVFDHVNAGAAIARLLLGGHFNVHSPHDQLVVHAIFAGAAALTMAAVMIRTWGAAYLQSEVVHDLALHNDTLVADGPYRRVRNPLYLGTLLLGAGMGLMASRLGWFVLVILLYLFHLRLIGREEAGLRKTQGESYAAYCATVPRLCPALRPRVPAGGRKPRWRQAFLGEAFLWAMAFAVALFAVTLNQRITFGIIFAMLAIYAIYVFGFRRLKDARTTHRD